jgi:hypothetical protein
VGGMTVPAGRGIHPKYRYAARVLHVRAPRELRLRIEATAKLQGITTSELIRKAIDTYLSAVEQQGQVSTDAAPPPARWGRW